jgi:hypothetical protein
MPSMLSVTKILFSVAVQLEMLWSDYPKMKERRANEEI